MSRQPRKTFTGCWTCRRRHLKCDESTPYCAKCVQSGFACEGYGLRLCWIPADSQAGHQSAPDGRKVIAGCRRALKSNMPANGCNMDWDVKKIKGAFAKKLSHRPTPSDGPFHVFDIKPATSSAIRRDEGRHNQSTPASIDHKRGRSGSSATTESQHQSSTFNESPCFPEPAKNDAYQSNVLREDSMNNEFGSTAANPDDGCSSITSSRSSSHGATQSRSVLSHRSQPLEVCSGAFTFKHLDLFPMPSQQMELINYWSSQICPRLLAVDSPENPFRAIFIPLAFQGLLCPAQSPDYRIALFHAICSASACSLTALMDNAQHYRSLALKHERLALNLFRHSLRAELQQDPTTMIALLSALIISDHVSGQPRNWRHHLRNGLQWLCAGVEAIGELTHRQQEFFQVFAYGAMFSNVQLDKKVVDFYFETVPLGPTLQALGLNSTLITIYRKIQQAMTDFFTDDMDLLEQELTLQHPFFQEETDDESSTTDSTRYNSAIFYYAILIFFRRECRLTPSNELQDFVSLGLSNMEMAAEHESASFPLSWPCLVILAECTDPDLQERALAWFSLMEAQSVSTESMRIIRIACLSVWEQRTLVPPEVNVRWQDVVQHDEMLDVLTV